MIRSIFWCTRQASGSIVQTPAATWRMNPPRTRSLCDTASASAGSSRSVGMKSFDARVAILGGRLVERNLGGFGHRERGGLGHLQTLRPAHPLGDPRVDLVEQLVDEDVRGDLLQHAAVRIDEADVAPACNPEVRVARLARAVDR